MTNPLLLIGLGLIAISLFMVVVWVLSRIIENSGIVDIAWALGFSLSAALYVYIGQASNLRQWAIVLMVTLWSLRLAWHLIVRFMRWYPAEDPRYTNLRSQMGSFADEKMLLVFLWQGAILTLMTAPLAVAIADHRADFGALQVAAIVIWSLALCGESLADFQLSRFSSDPAKKGQTCQSGLWRFSRHPNYFFEWLGSVAFFIYAADSPYGIWTIVCPVVLLHLLLNVSGVKPAEELSIKSRQGYAEYQRSTSAFVPWFRRKSL